jgi:hypothetical protein
VQQQHFSLYLAFIVTRGRTFRIQLYNGAGQIFSERLNGALKEP